MTNTQMVALIGRLDEIERRITALHLELSRLQRWRGFGQRLEPLLSTLLFNAGESGELVAELRARQHECVELLKVKPTNGEKPHERCSDTRTPGGGEHAGIDRKPIRCGRHLPRP
jgi:hypothetical protein